MKSSYIKLFHLINLFFISNKFETLIITNNFLNFQNDLIPFYAIF